jgi:hypothetical protein
MKRKLINAAAALLLAAPAVAGQKPAAAPQAKPKAAAAEPAAARTPAAAPAAPAAPPAWLTPPPVTPKNIKKGDIEVYTPVTGITTAQSTYEVFAPFDGRVEDMQAELFEYVTPKTLLGRMVSTEMAALLDSATEDERKQTERRWDELYKYFPLSPETPGIITNIYVSPKTKVSKGDRLFTIARKVVIIGRNTEPVYSKIAKGMTAELAYARNPEMKFHTVLADFIPLKNSPTFSRLWLEVTDLKEGIKIGEQFDGRLLVGKSSDTMLVPRGDIVEYGGRRFLVTEILSGLETADEVELLGHTSVFLGQPAQDGKDGKTKKDR